MKVILIGLVCLILTSNVVFSQEGWIPQKQVTGYIALQAEYFDGLEGFDQDYGIMLNEAGLLISYMPSPKLTFKSVIVYRPELTIEQVINEANFEYTVSEFVKIKVGRFLTPLSPMNTYYYAPVNNSITLPMIISHHEIFPLNVDGVSLNGFIGEQFKFDYNLFGGGFKNSMWSNTGVIGFLGAEQSYFEDFSNLYYSVDAESTNESLNLCQGAHVGFSYSDILSVGINVYNSSKESITVDIAQYDSQTGQVITDDSDSEDVKTNGPDHIQLVSTVFEGQKFVYGFNFELNLANIKMLGEFWRNEVNLNNDTNGEMNRNIDGAFVELSRNFNKLTPYMRFEYNNSAEIKYNRKTVGLNFKPMFETTFKLEYLRYDCTSSEDVSVDVNGIVGSVIYSF
jgi:hypothetical protein